MEQSLGLRHTVALLVAHIKWYLPAAMHAGELAIGLSVFYCTALVGASPPQVTLTSPVSGATVSGFVTLSADATNDLPITKLEFYVDGVLIGTAATDPYSTVWDARGATAGTHTVFAKAYDSPTSFTTTPTIDVTVADTVPPSVPATIQSPVQTVKTIKLTWDPSFDQIGTTGYHVYRNGNLVASPSGTQFTDSGLTPNTSYTYTLSAFDAAGNTSATSSPLSFSTLPDTTAPSVPATIHATDRALFSIALGWDASTDDVATTGYHVYRDGVLVASPVTNSFTDTGLSYNHSYTYTLSAFDAAGNTSALASYLTSTLPDTTPPSVPTAVQATDRQLFSISLAWDASTDDVSTAGYKVYRNGTLVGSPVTTSFTDTGLTYNTTYAYTITSYDPTGNTSAASTVYNVSTLPDVTPPSTPQNLQSPNQTVTTVQLVWTAATDDVGTTGYRVYRDGTLITSVATNTFTDTGLSQNTGYAYYVAAFDASGNVSPNSSTLSVSTPPDVSPPSVPANIHATDRQLFSITLQWDASTDDVATTGYHVYRNGSLLASPISSSYVDSGLTYNTAYTYTIAAYDAVGNTSALASYMVSTLPDTTPPNLTVTGITNGATISGLFPIRATATDQFGISAIHIFIDNLLVSSSTTDSVNYDWDSASALNTTHTVLVQAVDTNNNVTNNSYTIQAYNHRQGDLNGDGKVDIFDLSILLARWGKPGLGDFNGNGKVDIYDLSLLLHDYGR